jgi:hypothetical protein
MTMLQDSKDLNTREALGRQWEIASKHAPQKHFPPIFRGSLCDFWSLDNAFARAPGAVLKNLLGDFVKNFSKSGGRELTGGPAGV